MNLARSLPKINLTNPYNSVKHTMDKSEQEEMKIDGALEIIQYLTDQEVVKKDVKSNKVIYFLVNHLVDRGEDNLLQIIHHQKELMTQVEEKDADQALVKAEKDLKNAKEELYLVEKEREEKLKDGDKVSLTEKIMNMSLIGHGCPYQVRVDLAEYNLKEAEVRVNKIKEKNKSC